MAKNNFLAINREKVALNRTESHTVFFHSCNNYAQLLMGPFSSGTATSMSFFRYVIICQLVVAMFLEVGFSVIR